MTKKETTPYRQLAYVLFFGGITLLIISYLIQLVFISGTDFKTTYRQKQYQQCLKNNDPATCKQEFGN
jgi:hypothetical protein